mgnify:CR=1 FL=1
MIYADHAATTKMSETAKLAMLSAIEENWYNPSSLYTPGQQASGVLMDARVRISRCLGCLPKEIYFTSGGTEANNLAVMGTVNAKKRNGNKIVTTAIEHPSVLETMKVLEERGFNVVYIKPENGVIPLSTLEKEIDKDTILVSVMTVNNETGLVTPTEKIPAIIKKNNSKAVFHTDFVQGYGKLNCKVKKIGCDLLTVSSHKVHGPKGVGALYVKKGTRLVPNTYGGMQENKVRPGTEALPLICAFANAVEKFNVHKNYEKVKELHTYCMEQLGDIDGLTVNSTDFPYVINVSTNCVMSQTMLTYLADKYDVCISSGSACHKGELSHVLSAYGYSADRINSALRISFCESNTKEDVDALVMGIKNGLKELVKFK